MVRLSRRDEFDTARQPQHPQIWDMDIVKAHNHLIDDHGFDPYWNVDDLRGAQHGGSQLGDDVKLAHDYIHMYGSDDDGRPAPKLHQHHGSTTKWRRPDENFTQWQARDDD